MTSNGPDSELALPWSSALRDRFGFTPPPAYQLLEDRELFSWSSECRDKDLSVPGNHYLWFCEMEWYGPIDLRNFQFASYHREGFVPFAHAGNGDYWCWLPAEEDEKGIPVILCPHDCSDADRYGPDFASAMFRNALEYAVDVWQESDDEGRRHLCRFVVDLAAIWPTHWCDRLTKAKDKGLDWDGCKEFIDAEFGDRFTEYGDLQWMD